MLSASCFANLANLFCLIANAIKASKTLTEFSLPDEVAGANFTDLRAVSNDFSGCQEEESSSNFPEIQDNVFVSNF